MTQSMTQKQGFLIIHEIIMSFTFIIFRSRNAIDLFQEPVNQLR